ncbi:MAG: hypothetical protein ABIF71_14730 [Planctomycetota bacterium]
MTNIEHRISNDEGKNEERATGDWALEDEDNVQCSILNVQCTSEEGEKRARRRGPGRGEEDEYRTPNFEG